MKEARGVAASDPGTAAEVIVSAARVRHRLGDDAGASALIDEAAAIVTSQLAGRFLKLQKLDQELEGVRSRPSPSAGSRCPTGHAAPKGPRRLRRHSGF